MQKSPSLNLVGKCVLFFYFCYSINIKLSIVTVEMSQDGDSVSPYLPTIQFLFVCANGDTKTAFSMLETGIEDLYLDYYNWDGYTALYVAIFCSPTCHLDLIYELLLKGANPNDYVAKSTSSRTILQHVVCDYQKTDLLQLVNLLLEQGGSIMMKDSDGNTALGIAVKRERWDLVEVILDHGIATTNFDYYEDFYQLCKFMVNNDYDAAESLLDVIYDVDFKEMDEITPMRFAFYMEDDKFIMMLNLRKIELKLEIKSFYRKICK